MKYQAEFRKEYFGKLKKEGYELNGQIFVQMEKDIYIEWLETKLQNTYSNSDYAVAVKNLINSEVDCVQTKNGAYVNLDGVIDCLNHALHDFT